MMSRSDLEALAKLLAPLVAAHIAAALSGPGGYSTRKGFGIPGYCDKESKRIVRSIGVKRGRWWFASREQVEAYEAKQHQVEAVAVTEEPMTFEKAAARAGLRLGGR